MHTAPADTIATASIHHDELAQCARWPGETVCRKVVMAIFG